VLYVGQWELGRPEEDTMSQLLATYAFELVFGALFGGIVFIARKDEAVLKRVQICAYMLLTLCTLYSLFAASMFGKMNFEATALVVSVSFAAFYVGVLAGVLGVIAMLFVRLLLEIGAYLYRNPDKQLFGS
jgi:hypothetical protein